MQAKESNNGGMIVLEPIIQKYIFAKRFSGDDAREIYNAVVGRISKDFKNAPAFNGYFKFNNETQEINGSNLYHRILIDDELRASGLRLPSVSEGKTLDASKKLTHDVCRDYGIAVYNIQDPNSELAQRLIKETIMRSLKLPLLAPFSALKLGKVANKKVPVLLREEIPDVITGEEAQKYLDDCFDYQGNSGVQGLHRGRAGGWHAEWECLDESVDYGRVDWVCGEATREILEKAHLELSERNYEEEVRKLKEKQKEDNDEFRESLKR